MERGKRALLIDFGLAKMTEASVQLTRSGFGVSTLAYMSPEQGQGKKVDARSNVYSLGVVLYEMLTGRVLYEAETPMAVVIKRVTAPLPLPRKITPDIPEALKKAATRAIEEVVPVEKEAMPVWRRVPLWTWGAGTDTPSPPTPPPFPTPSGGRIAFVSRRDSNGEICVMNADPSAGSGHSVSGVTRLTNNSADDRHPSWGP